MKLGIIGSSLSGKKTVFEALTKRFSGNTFKDESRLETVTVPDYRIDSLSEMFVPEKKVYAQIKYFLPQKHDGESVKDAGAYNRIRDCDALIHIIKNFKTYDSEKTDPYEDFFSVEQELILADLMVAEKRIERLITDKNRSKGIDNNELSLLKEVSKLLEAEKPIRTVPEIASAQQLRGYCFLTAKPKLLLFNNSDWDEDVPSLDELDEEMMVLRGKLEHEIMQMPEKDAVQFLKEFNISGLAMNRVIKKSYDLLGLISFFTVGKDEVRAWTIKKDTSALDAAEVIHSDIKKGFIRAEVVAYTDLMKAGSYPKAKESGTVRLEGKTYTVLDGDIINFRFNV